MKFFDSGIFATFWIFTAFVVVAIACMAMVSRAQPILHLDFEQDIGPRVVDAVSGRPVGGAADLGVTFGVPGPPPDEFPGMDAGNHAARFNGQAQVTLDAQVHEALRGKPALTLEAWVRPGKHPPGQVNIVTFYVGDASGLSFVLITEPTGRSLVIGGRSTADDRFGGARAPLRGDGWTHVVGVLDFARSEARLYLNGHLESSSSVSGRWSHRFYQPPPQSKLPNLASMGDGRYFRGDLDGVKVYAYALDDPDGDGGRADSQVKPIGEPDVTRFSPRPMHRVKYNHPGLIVDLGTGLMARASAAVLDHDGDGYDDLILFCDDKPWSGTYLFRNTGEGGDDPIFEPPVRLGDAAEHLQASYVHGKLHILDRATAYTDFASRLFDAPVKLPLPDNVHDRERIRANQWRYVDYDGDGATDIAIGVGDWSDYGWDNAFDKTGAWTNGPVHGYVYLILNTGTDEQPSYAAPTKLKAGGAVIDVMGMPSPCFADFDGDGDLDMICGEFVDGFTYFENTGTRHAPRYAAGRALLLDGEPLRVETCMPAPIAYDWNRDGWPDLVTTVETGGVLLIEHTGGVRDGMPVFVAPKPFRQRADDLKFGVLATPVSFDWNGDGRDDLICGNAAGHIGFIENLDGGDPPKWAAPVLLEADGQVIRIQAGDNGSIQGPIERKWGYTAPSVVDWDMDGLPDLVVNSIWGKVIWYRNVGTRTQPRLAAAQPVEVAWPGRAAKPAWMWWQPEDHQLATQWRTTPVALDYTGDGLPDLVMLDAEGFLALFERQRVGDTLMLMPPRRIFYTDGPSVFNQVHKPVNAGAGLLQLNNGVGGRSGRRKLTFTDFDGDGKLDLIVNSTSVDLLRAMTHDTDRTIFRQAGTLGDRVLAGHTTSPTVVNWDGDEHPDLLIGAEDGCFYYLKNPFAAKERE